MSKIYWNGKIKTARKNYTCINCNKPINKGDKYFSYQGKERISFGCKSTIRTRQRCLNCAPEN